MCCGKTGEFLLYLTFFVNLKFAEYPCFSVVLAGSLHFPKEKYFLYIICSSVLE